MKIRVKAIKNWYLTGSILIIFLSSFCYSTTGIKESFITISVSEAKELVDNDEELFVLDVRNPYEFEAGHILGAYLIPVNDIFARKDELPKNTSTSILVYCQSGYRSATASDTLDSLGYTQVKNMAYGFSAWIGAGYPYE
ncbi:MAG: rhodanese-like domain-containing protein, partial [Promethearchaeota archaeon]